MIELDAVKERLTMLGFPPSTADEPLLLFEIDKWTQYSLTFMNLTELPYETVPKIIDKICFEVLSLKKNNGSLENFDYSPGITEIKEGDTTIKYNGSDSVDSPVEKRFQKILNNLDSNLNNWLVHFRKLRW